MNKVLILSKGYVSSKIEQHWGNKYDSLISVSRKDVDYLEKDNLNKLIHDLKPTSIINCYGFTGKPNVDSCETSKDECNLRNIDHNLKILKHGQDLEIPVITISSGCIYNDDLGETEYKEEDPHNFGWSNPTASVYSKSKSKFETDAVENNLLDNNYLIRIRMPFDDDFSDDKNYISKILKYDKLVNYKNSLTHLGDLAQFVKTLSKGEAEKGIYNFTNTQGIPAEDIISMANELGWNKKINKWYSTDDMLSEDLMKCRRSNCVLDNSKVKNIFDISNSYFRVEEALYNNKK